MRGRVRHSMWIAPLAVAGVVAAFGWWANDRVRETLEAQLKAKLNATLDATVNALEGWTEIQTRLASSLANEPEVRAAALRLLQRETGSSEQVPRNWNPEDLDLLSSRLGPRLRDLGYDMVQLVSTNFTVSATIRREGMPGIRRPFEPGGVDRVAEAHTNKFAELFTRGQPVIITPFKPEFTARGFGRRGRGGPGLGPSSGERAAWLQSRLNDLQRRLGNITLMQVAAPVRENGVVRGALALVINPTEFTRTLSVARTGESGETYAFDQTGLLISQSRFDAQLYELGLLDRTNSSSALNFRLHDPGGDITKGFKPATTNLASLPLTQIVSRALEGESGVDVTPSRDYRGVPVVGAWRWLPELGFGVATQMDADEAYEPLRVLRLIFIVLTLLLVLCAITLFLFSYVNITWRKRWSEAELKLKQLGQYTLEEKIGEGGMGTVYRARHALLRRDTAVKLLSPDRADATSIQRFEREVRLTCQLAHPNTIQVYDYGHTPDGVFYYAMEYLRGLNLHDLVARFGPQPEGRVVHILMQVCESLSEAHSLGLVHRDIKPANVFLCDRGGIPDAVKVLDFGLVREYGPNAQDKLLTGEDGFAGTPCFMPPEAFKGASRSDPRSDIYSTGALGYYLLTGTVVFEGETAGEIYEKQLTMEPTPPSRRTNNPISTELEDLLIRCLRRSPEERPGSAEELHRLLAATPHAHAFTEEDRAAWWARYHEQTLSPAPVPGSTPAPNTVRINIASRIAQ